MSFETDLKKLDELTEKIKKEETGLEEALLLYEEASKLTKKLNKTLEDVKRKIEAVSLDSTVEEIIEDE